MLLKQIYDLFVDLVKTIGSYYALMILFFASIIMNMLVMYIFFVQGSTVRKFVPFFQQEMLKLSEGILLLSSGPCPQTASWQDLSTRFDGMYIMVDGDVHEEIVAHAADGSHHHRGGGHIHEVIGSTEELGENSYPQYAPGGILAPNRARELSLDGHALVSSHAHDEGAHQHAHISVRLCRFVEAR